MDKAFSLIPGKHKVNLHSTYADTEESIDWTRLNRATTLRGSSGPRSTAWVWTSTPPASPMKRRRAATPFERDEGIRRFWIEHCRRSRRVGEYFGKELGQKCVTNVWIPDGSKDVPVDRYAPRLRLKESLDEIFAEKLDPAATLTRWRSKLFGIGSESYVVGSHEFYMGYAMKNNVAVCLGRRAISIPRRLSATSYPPCSCSATRCCCTSPAPCAGTVTTSWRSTTNCRRSPTR